MKKSCLKISVVFALVIAFSFTGCHKNEEVPVTENQEIEEQVQNQDIVEPVEIETPEVIEKVKLPLESVKKYVPVNVEDIDTSEFTDWIPDGFYAVGTYIVPKEGVSVKIYAGARADDERCYGEFSEGEIAVIEDIYKYYKKDVWQPYFWYQICVLSTGMEGWIKVQYGADEFRYSCDEKDFDKDNYTIHSINADIEVTRKTGTINQSQGGNSQYNSIAVSPSGDEFATKINNTIYLYDAGSDTEKAVIESGDDVRIEKRTKCVYSRNGDTLFIVNAYGEVYSYLIETKELKKIFQFTFDDGSLDSLGDIYISPDDRFIFAEIEIRWNGRGDTLPFVYDRKLEKQQVFDIRSESHQDAVCGRFSEFIFTQTNDVYASAGNYYGNEVFLHFYVDSDDELKVEQYECDEDLNLLAKNPVGDEFISFENNSGIFQKSDLTGKETKKQLIKFSSQNTSYPIPYFSCVNSEGTLAVFKYVTENNYENLAIYSLSTLNLLGVIKHEVDENNELSINEFSGNNLIVEGKGSQKYDVYTLNIEEREDQFVFSVPYDEKIENLSYSWDWYSGGFTFYGYWERFEGISEGPGGAYYSMRVAFYPNGFYKITSRGDIEDFWILGTVYGTYEMDWPNLRLFTATQQYGGDYEHEFDFSDFYDLPIVKENMEDTRESIEMTYIEELKKWHNTDVTMPFSPDFTAR